MDIRRLQREQGRGPSVSSTAFTRRQHGPGTVMVVNVTPADTDANLDASLREDIRALGALLGQSLAGHSGPGLLDLVEQVRAAVREHPDAATAIIDSLDLHDATMMARAFSIYFDLANVAEQVQRARDVRATRRAEGSVGVCRAREIGVIK